MNEKIESSKKKVKKNPRVSSMTAKLKARCEFLGIHWEGLNNRQRKSEVRKATGNMTWPIYLATLDQDPEKDGSIEYRRTERKIKKQERAKTREERQIAHRKRSEEARKKQLERQGSLRDKHRRQLDRKIAQAQRQLDKMNEDEAKWAKEKKAYEDKAA